MYLFQNKDQCVYAVVQSLSRVQLFATPWTVACQTLLSFTSLWSLLRFLFIELVMLSNRFILCHPLLFLPSIFPSIRIFFNELTLCVRWPKYWSITIIFPVNIQGWFPLELAGLISLLSKVLSRIFSSITTWKYQFFGAQPSLWPTLLSAHDYWENHSFDYLDLCWQSDVSAF